MTEATTPPAMRVVGPTNRAEHHARLLGVEHFMGWARIVGCALALSQFAVYDHFPAGVKPAGIAVALAYLVLGTWTLLRLHRPIRSDRLRQMVTTTLVIDTVLLVAINLLLAYERDSTTRGLLLLMVIQGAMKFSRRGAWGVAAVVVAHEVARGVIAAVVWDLAIDPAEASFFVGLAVMVAMFAGQMASIADEALARSMAREAEAEDARGDLQQMHRILLAGVESLGSTDEGEFSLGRMLRGAASTIGFRTGRLVLTDRSGVPVTVARSGPDADQPLTPPTLVVITIGSDEPAVRTTLDDGDVEIAVPVRFHDDRLGALVFRGPTTSRRVDDRMLTTLGNQTGMIVHAAQALENEARLNERLKELDRLKSDFVAVASHELRTPLTAILGFAETLQHRSDRIPAQMHERLLGSIVTQSRRLQALVDDLNTVLDIDGGVVGTAVAPVHVGSAVEAAIDRAKAEGVAVEIPDGLQVEADAAHLQRVLANLIENAVQHGGGGVVVRTRTQEGQVLIDVHDDGVGLNAEQRSLVFERFYQAVPAGAHSRGTGLGLPIARALAQAMGGDIVIAPADQGTTFQLRLARAADLTPGRSSGPPPGVDVRADEPSLR